MTSLDPFAAHTCSAASATPDSTQVRGEVGAQRVEVPVRVAVQARAASATAAAMSATTRPTGRTGSR